MKYIYFVSYYYKLDEYNHGYGNAEMISSNKYTSMEHLKATRDILRHDNSFEEVVILNYQLLRTERIKNER